MLDEEPEAIHQSFTRRQIFFRPHPGARPALHTRQQPETSKAETDVGTRFIVEVSCVEPVRAMELTTILNHCHHFRGFVYQYARFGPDKKTIEVAIRPWRARRPSPRVARNQRQVTINFPSGALSSFLSGAFWFSSCTACGASTAATAAWWWKRFLGGDGKHQLTRAYMLFLARWARKLSWKETAEVFRTSWEKVCDAVEYVVTWAWSIARSLRSPPSVWMKCNTPKATNI